MTVLPSMVCQNFGTGPAFETASATHLILFLNGAYTAFGALLVTCLLARLFMSGSAALLAVLVPAMETAEGSPLPGVSDDKAKIMDADANCKYRGGIVEIHYVDRFSS